MLNTPERVVAQALTDSRAHHGHLRFALHGVKWNGALNAPAAMAGDVRKVVLRACATALSHGYDGGEVAPRPRSADEHRVADVWVGSVVLSYMAAPAIAFALCHVDWYQVVRLVAHAIAPITEDSTPS